MKKRINLFNKNRVNTEVDSVVKKITLTVLGVNVFLFIGVLFLFGLNIQMHLQVNSLISKRAELIETLKKQNTLQSKINTLAYKTKQLQVFEKDDAQSAKYYNLLKQLFDSQGLPLFNALKVSKNHEVAFGVDVDSLEESNNVLSYLESDPFLSYFKKMTLDKFTYNSSEVKGKYSMQFIGQFNDTNETP
jgi:hypothetical protein